jgi:hypothetical protein
VCSTWTNLGWVINWEVLTARKIIVVGVRMTEILVWQFLGELIIMMNEQFNIRTIGRMMNNDYE